MCTCLYGFCVGDCKFCIVLFPMPAFHRNLHAYGSHTNFSIDFITSHGFCLVPLWTPGEGSYHGVQTHVSTRRNAASINIELDQPIQTTNPIWPSHISIWMEDSRPRDLTLGCMFLYRIRCRGRNSLIPSYRTQELRIKEPIQTYWFTIFDVLVFLNNFIGLVLNFGHEAKDFEVVDQIESSMSRTNSEVVSEYWIVNTGNALENCSNFKKTLHNFTTLHKSW